MTSSSRRTPPPTSRARSRALRAAPRKSFLERNRGRLIWGIAGLALVAGVALAFLNATAPAYGCSNQWVPDVTPSPAPGATPRLGYVEPDMGRSHVQVGMTVKYALCPPASGKHYAATGEGPIPPGVYGPDDGAVPEGWIHNMEHGGLVVLYRCKGGDTGCSDADQAAFREFNATFPNSPLCNFPAGSLSPVIARFDDMAFPYAALLWGQVLPMQEFDPQLVRDYFAQQGELTNPEQQCARPSPTPEQTATPVPGESPATSESPAASGSPAPSASPAGS